MICDRCDESFSGNHRAWCSSCNKPHPICDKCYEECIKSGELKKEKVNIGDLNGAGQWT